MEAKEVVDLIGKEVWWSAKDCYADIVAYEKGWVTIKTDDEQKHKVRAKDLVLMDSDEALVETEEGLETVKEDPLSDSSDENSEINDQGEILCNCGLCFMPPRDESFRCPSCGRWHRVRLHPDLSKYVKGMAETASGRDTVDIDDYVATMLRGYNLMELYKKVCEELHKLDERARFSKPMHAKFVKSGLTCSEFLEEKYEYLNQGMQRMNLGNLLRGAYKRQQVLDLTKENNGDK